MVSIKSPYLCQSFIFNPNMNKAELVAKIAQDTGLTKVQATAALESFMDGVSKGLRSGKRITLVGFGTFTVVRRAARKGRNPATGEAIKIKAKKVVKFKAGNELAAKL
jgi:DNA-binding protein HU-beta